MSHPSSQRHLVLSGAQKLLYYKRILEYALIIQFLRYEAGNIRVFHEQSSQMRKLKLGETSMHQYFTYKACGGCGFLTLTITTANISSEGS